LFEVKEKRIRIEAGFNALMAELRGEDVQETVAIPADQLPRTGVVAAKAEPVAEAGRGDSVKRFAGMTGDIKKIEETMQGWGSKAPAGELVSVLDDLHEMLTDIAKFSKFTHDPSERAILKGIVERIKTRLFVAENKYQAAVNNEQKLCQEVLAKFE
jgi:hypothetical protein